MRLIPAVLLASAVGCNGTNFVGSKFIKSVAISAADGGTITVLSSDDVNLEGTQIYIAPNALPNDTTITIAEAAGLSPSQLGGTTQDGTTADLGPDTARFSVPATVTLRFAADSGPDVAVIGVEHDGTFFTVDPLSIDAGVVSFSASGFTSYAVVHRPPTGDCTVATHIVCDADGGQTCVDPLVDPSNCGGCGLACQAGESCQTGGCQCNLMTCTGDAGTVCTDTESDRLNCSSCNKICPTGENCTQGECVCHLTPTIGQCPADGGPACVDLQTNNANCGSCGNLCTAGHHCAAPAGAAGVCVCDEPDGGPPIFENCRGTCVDTSRDPRNCGDCGNFCVSESCSPGDSGTGFCDCRQPYTECEQGCVDTFGDVNHCGSCDNDCYILAPGLTELSCNLGHCYCGPTGQGTICPNSVCATIGNDPSNCGSCGHVCEAPGEDCLNGICTCPFSETLCGLPDAGIPLFCVDPIQDPANCGVCGNVCNNSYAIGSVCDLGLCSCPPFKPYLCGVAGSGQCLPTDGGCDAGSETWSDGG